MKIIEATGPNINLLVDLADIFISYYERNYKEYFESKLKNDTFTGIYGIDNPYPNFENRIRKYTDDENILNELLTMDFSMDARGYQFKDDNVQTSAAATYDSVSNKITFYHPKYVNKNVLVHELRHAIQFAQYERTRKKSTKDRSRPYRDRPIEIDAFWSEKFYFNIEYGIPETKEKII
jgi:hypothetical protein